MYPSIPESEADKGNDALGALATRAMTWRLLDVNMTSFSLNIHSKRNCDIVHTWVPRSALLRTKRYYHVCTTNAWTSAVQRTECLYTPPNTHTCTCVHTVYIHTEMCPKYYGPSNAKHIQQYIYILANYILLHSYSHFTLISVHNYSQSPPYM